MYTSMLKISISAAWLAFPCHSYSSLYPQDKKTPAILLREKHEEEHLFWRMATCDNIESMGFETHMVSQEQL